MGVECGGAIAGGPRIALGSEIGFANIYSAAKPPGRPKDPASARTCQPWRAQGISQRTFYRRKALAAASAPPPPQQQSAHVAAWFATLGPIARLEHKALMRRCLAGMPKEGAGS